MMAFVPSGFGAFHSVRPTAPKCRLTHCSFALPQRALSRVNVRPLQSAIVAINDVDVNFPDPLALSSSDEFDSLAPHSSETAAESSSSGAQTSDLGVPELYSPPGGSGRPPPGGSSNSGGRDGSSRGGDDYDDLPSDMRAALLAGLLPERALSRYYEAIKGPLMRLLLAVPGFRARFLMDSAFVFKILVQEAVGNGTALLGEIIVRGKDIVDELEYVASDLIVGTVIEGAFVWFLTPVLPNPSVTPSALGKILASLPAHAFQPSTATQSFTISQRLLSFINGSVQYGMVGLGAGVVGTLITYGLLEARKTVDKTYKPARTLPAVLPNAAGWAAFMATSCSVRFQAVEGLEVLLAKVITNRAGPAMQACVISLRFVNNTIGGVQFVHFFRTLGLHATHDATAQ